MAPGKIAHPDFARRMKIACDANKNIPPLKEGRLKWIKDAMGREGMELPLQTIFRYYHGEMRPRHPKLLVLSKVIGADPAWLSVGHAAETDVTDKRSHAATNKGVVNAVIGFFQLAGIACAFPENDDPFRTFVHFYAINKGVQHRVHVAAVRQTDAKFAFRAPNEHERCVVLGIIRRSPFALRVFNMPSEVIAKHGQSSGGFITVEVDAELQVDGTKLPELRDPLKL